MQPKEFRLGDLEEAGAVAGLHIRLDPGGNPGSGRFDVQTVADHFSNDLAQSLAVAKPERVRFTDGLPDGAVAGRRVSAVWSCVQLGRENCRGWRKR